MRRAQRGEQAAFALLFERWRRPIFSFLMRRTGRRESAEEAFQNTWLRAWQWRARYDPTRPFRPWLYTVAANAGCDARRVRPDEFELKHEPGSGSDPFLGRDELVSALHGLSPGDRELLLLTGEGFTANEIGEMEGLKPGTVRMRVMRARKRIRSQIVGDDLVSPAVHR